MSHAVVRTALERALEEMGAPSTEVHLERPRDPAHGDVATNVAMTLASILRKPPREIAEELVRRISEGEPGIERVEVAGPGFLNFHLSTDRVTAGLREVLELDESFGKGTAGEGRPVVVEFVSANPTGPLHLGHGRQAALGDTISALLEWNGWEAYREFYYNDAGRQIELLARSVQARYLEHFGRDASVPEDGYHGVFVIELARAFAETAGDRYLEDSPEGLAEMRRFAVDRIRKEQDRDLSDFGVHFDEYYLETSLYDEGRVDRTIERLRETGLVYEHEGALWLRTTEYGDQKDRVMVKSDGSPTYFLPDVAYHLTKWERGFQDAINVQGADHHGTVDRVRAGLRALGLPAGYPEYVLHQMVTVEREGKEVKFSKRAGSYITLRELVEEVGADVTRYFFLMRKPEAHLVFDLDMALDQSDKNPVYKVQYAHARICSIFRKAGLDWEDVDPEAADLTLLETEQERELAKKLTEFPELIARAGAHRAPHLVCEYLEQTAGQVNSWYHAGNPTRNPQLAVLVDDTELRRARLALASAIRVVLRNGLRLLGLNAPVRMEKESD